MALQSLHEKGTIHAAENSILLRQTRQRNSGLGRGCIYAWGRGNTAPIILNAAYWNGIGRGPAEIGIPTATGDYGGNLWGNDTQVGTGAGDGRIDEAWTYLKNNGAATDKVFLLGISMGGAVVCNWARLNPTKVAAIALVTPAIDLNDLYSVTRTDLQGEINTAYGNAAGFTAARPTHSPAEYAASLSGLPIKVWYSSNDPDITPSTVTTFASASGASTVSVGAQGHGVGTALLPSDIATFFRENA